MSTNELASALKNTIGDGHAIAGAALGVSLHLTRVLANRGLLSPSEAETIFSAMMEPIETAGSEGLQANTVANLGPLMAEIRLWAQERWIGKGKTDPA